MDPKPHIQLRPEGFKVILLAILATLVFAFLGWAVPALLGLVATALTLNFFRDPDRVIPNDPDVAVAPADGRVVLVQARQDPFTGEQKKCIGIFMNIFNVHVNRFPIAGQVTSIKYYPGKFIKASLDKASTDNERCALLITDQEQKNWTVVQIAGLVARRIVCLAQPGDFLSRGKRFGIIKFGSRVDLYLPQEYESVVNVGEKTFAGQSIVARKAS